MPDSISDLVAFNVVSSNLFPFRVSFVVQKWISADHCFNSIWASVQNMIFNFRSLKWEKYNFFSSNLKSNKLSITVV